MPQDESSSTTRAPRTPEGAETLRRAPEPPPATGGVQATVVRREPIATAGELPARIGRYPVIRELGRGGMGAVYLVTDPQLHREVALKVLPRAAAEDAELLQRFVREAEAAAKLAHPHIVAIHDVGSAEIPGEVRPLPYFTMEHVRGGSLADLLRARGRLAPVEALRLVRDVADGVAYAHSCGIVHRDLKPENILLEPPADGSSAGLRPKLSDFGLARNLGVDAPGRLTVSGIVLGTPAHMSPEQARGDSHEVDFRSDVYSLGSVLYEALTGMSPFAGRSGMEMIAAKLREDPPRPRSVVPTLAVDVQTIVLKALEREKSRRYAGAKEFADDLGRFLAGEAISARPPGRIERLTRWSARNPALCAATVALALALLGLAWFFFDRSRQAQRQAEALIEARRIAQAEALERRARAMPHHVRGEDLREKSRVLIRVKKFEDRSALLQEAEKEYGQALERDPTFVEAWAGRARVRAELGDHPQALADLARALELNSTYTDALLVRLAIRTEAYETLLVRGAHVREQDFENLQAIPDLSADPAAKRLREEIRGDAARVAELGIKPEQAAYFEGWLCRVDRDLEGAARCFARALEAWPYYPEALEGRGSLPLLRHDEDLSGAEHDLKAALALDPGLLRARYFSLFLLFRKEQPTAVLGEIQTLIQLRPRFAPLYVLRGYLQFHYMKNDPGALEDFETALRCDADCLLAYFLKGTVLAGQGRREEALAAWGAALERDRGCILAWLSRCRILQYMHRWDDANAAADGLIAADPGYATGYVERGHIAEARRDRPAALREYQRAHEVDPDSTPGVWALANALQSAGRGAEALALCDAETGRRPSEASLQLLRANVLQGEKRFADALAAYEKILTLKTNAGVMQSARQSMEQCQRALEKEKK